MLIAVPPTLLVLGSTGRSGRGVYGPQSRRDSIPYVHCRRRRRGHSRLCR